MAAVSVLGLYGGPWSPHGSFAGKTPSVDPTAAVTGAPYAAPGYFNAKAAPGYFTPYTGPGYHNPKAAPGRLR